MNYYSTRDPGRTRPAGFAEAVLAGLAPDGGLYVPETLPRLDPAELAREDFRGIARRVARSFAGDELGTGTLDAICDDAFDFDLPLRELEPGRHALELFHGPTGAFKDFGARFMARVMGRLMRGRDERLLILTATSGDTGGAVASGFSGVPGIDVVVLYPQGRVSPLQERQIAGAGANVRAVAVEGSFDDCQALIKRALVDPSTGKGKGTDRGRIVSSANSINIARLVPQSFYYWYAATRLAPAGGGRLLACVPSGNAGNLTAGLYARAMGAPIASFVAATNANRTLPEYLATGRYEPKASVATISNAMDVGAPSNFERASALLPYGEFSGLVRGMSLTDDETRATIRRTYGKSRYVLEPHGAIAWEALGRAMDEGRFDSGFACLTADPAKFAETVEPLIGTRVPVPASLAAAEARTIRNTRLPNEYAAFTAWLAAEIET